VRRCEVTGCVDGDDSGGVCSPVCAAATAASSSSPAPAPPLALRLTRWDCPADCKYLCMWAAEGRRRRAWADRVERFTAVEEQAEESGSTDPDADAADATATPRNRNRTPPPPGPFQTFKYFGKWPFARVLGAQEIGSVLTSLANLAAVAHNLVLYTRALQRTATSGGKGGSGAPSSSSSLAALVLSNRHPYPYALLWYAHAFLACNAWLWSAVFHTRDTRITERLDYFSAGALVAAGLAAALARALGVLPRRPRAAALLAALAAAWWLSHVRYMSRVKFDYSYNMAVCIALGVAQAGVWLAFLLLPQRQVPPSRAPPPSSPSSPSLRHPGRRPALLFLAAIHAAMLLEVLDFPPMFFALVDAHCLWHAATAPLAYLWWRFLLVDVAWWAAGGGGEAGERAATGGGGVVSGPKSLGGGGNSSPGGGSSGGDQEAGVERRRRRV
jgi:uncharacterized membrane protein YgcG